MLLLGVGALGLWTAGTAGAGDALVIFTARSSAEATRMSVVQPGAVASDSVVDAGGAVAMVELSSAPSSIALAAYPYPGGTVLDLPATAAGGGAPVPVPAYPLVASSSYPETPKAGVSAGPYSVTAATGPESSTAAATSGNTDESGSSGHVAATGSAARAQGVVTAKASTDVRSLVFADLVVGSVHSAVTVVRSSPTTLQRSVEFAATGLSVAGMPFGIGPGGLVVAGTTTPLPSPSPVTDALTEGGVTVAYIDGRQTPDGVTSPALEVSLHSEQGGREVTVTYVLGRASAAVIPGTDGSASGGGGPVGGSGSSGDVPATGGGSSAPDEPEGTRPGSAAPGIVPGETGSGTDGSAGAPPTLAGGPAPGSGLAGLVAGRPGGWSESFYLVVAAGGLLALLSATLVRLRGVRHP